MWYLDIAGFIFRVSEEETVQKTGRKKRVVAIFYNSLPSGETDVFSYVVAYVFCGISF